MTIHEPAVTLTDYGLTVECAVLVWLLYLGAQRIADPGAAEGPGRVAARYRERGAPG